MLQGNFTVTYRPVHSIPTIELSRAKEEGRVDPVLLDLPLIRKDCRLYCAPGQPRLSRKIGPPGLKSRFILRAR
jgi:hypothetical protein